VGDRYFTDVVYGNNNGFLTIRSAPLTAIGEPFVVQQVRRLEDAVVERWQRLGVQPKAHPLYEGPHEFIKDPACW
jgi:phosphatidylglycerophosphatase GEP4